MYERFYIYSHLFYLLHFFLWFFLRRSIKRITFRCDEPVPINQTVAKFVNMDTNCFDYWIWNGFETRVPEVELIKLIFYSMFIQTLHKSGMNRKIIRLNENSTEREKIQLVRGSTNTNEKKWKYFSCVSAIPGVRNSLLINLCPKNLTVMHEQSVCGFGSPPVAVETSLRPDRRPLRSGEASTSFCLANELEISIHIFSDFFIYNENVCDEHFPGVTIFRFVSEICQLKNCQENLLLFFLNHL